MGRHVWIGDLRSYCWDSGMLYIKIAGILYLKELYKFVSSIWIKKQLKQIPLRALKGGKMPLDIFMQASKQGHFGKKNFT